MALVKISRGADIQHNYVNGVSRVSILEGAYKDATVERISLQPGADFSAELYDFFPHLFYDIGQNICPDMRLCIVENFRLRAVFYKNRKDMSAASVFILDQSVQFAV